MTLSARSLQGRLLWLSLVLVVGVWLVTAVSTWFDVRHELDELLDGQVLDAFGASIPGLYAAGRTSAGMPSAPYMASGVSIGDCTFFGRRAGRHAAREQKS